MTERTQTTTDKTTTDKTTPACQHCTAAPDEPCDYPGTLCPGRVRSDDMLRRLTIGARSAAAVGLPVIATICEDAATEIILMSAEARRGAL